MSQISNYTEDTIIDDDDKLLGSDGKPGATFNNTKNFKLKDIKQYVRSGGAMYKVYTALLTQSGASMTLATISGDPFTIGVTYRITNPGIGADFTNIGAPNNNIGTYFVATGTTPNSYGTGVCNLQYNPGAPVVTVLENTIGNIWFTISPGWPIQYFYSAVSDNLFINNKTTPFGGWYKNNGAGLSWVSYNRVSAAEVYIETNSTGILSKTPIEIRIYD